MRAVVQRVLQSDVTVENHITGSIGRGIMVLLGVEVDDNEMDLTYMVEKITGLRIFDDEQGKMNLSLADVGGAILVVSQFTLYGDCRKGKRPGFTQAAGPEKAIQYYRKFVEQCIERDFVVEEGVFQADMLVRIHNDGPVTILLDSKKLF